VESKEAQLTGQIGGAAGGTTTQTVFAQKRAR
jgi:hypothetical protein